MRWRAAKLKGWLNQEPTIVQLRNNMLIGDRLADRGRPIAKAPKRQ